jgi:hypothetical protein
MILAQAANFWNGDNGSTGLWIKIIGALVFGFLLIAVFTRIPAQFRRPIVVSVTFLAGFVYIAYWLWPQPVAREAGTLPNGPIENVGFFLDDSVQVVGGFYNILAGFLLGLGVYSILRIHVRKLAKLQQDWAFSAVLLVSMLLMLLFGYWDWKNHLDPTMATVWEDVTRYPWNNKVYDILFEGLLQQMDAAMFSIIAFYILSAAYRAFRVRSVEATILLGTALIVMLSLMGAVAYLWDVKAIGGMTGGDQNSFINNFQLSSISGWLRDTFQTSSLRGVDFGVGIGALAMGMRLWLSLERGGVSQ